MTTASAAEKDNDPDFFAVASADKTEPDVNDQIIYTVKLYMDPNAQVEAVGNINFKFNGFKAEEVDPFFFQNYGQERYKGKIYRTLVWKQFVLTPEKKGTFIIPAHKATASLIVYSGNNDDTDPFSFFFGRRRGQRKAVKFSLKALKIKVTGTKKKSKPDDQQDADQDSNIDFKRI